MVKRLGQLVILMALAMPLSAEDLKTIKLAAPELTTGTSLMQALKDRQSSRTFSKKPLPDEVLSQLLWAADGVNRPGSGKRTAPSAMNWQEIDIFVATAEGLYRYTPNEHALLPIIKQDIRALTGKQPFVSNAPVNLIYVADASRISGNSSAEEKMMYMAADTGFISQNVYLYCASVGLVTVVRGFIDKDALAKAMQLKGTQTIILAQSVGYPKE